MRNEASQFSVNADTKSMAGDSLEGVPAALLVGGLGTRLRSVLPSTPKSLARVGDAPFLQLLIQQLRSQGVRRLVLCTGHLAAQVEEEFGNGQKWDLEIEYSQEERPLGTGGAIKFAARFLSKAADFLVLNGDSFLELDIHKLANVHRESRAIATIATRRVPDTSRYGTVELDSNNRVIAFNEKQAAQVPGVVNGGVYLFNRSILQEIPDGPASLEKDVFPKLLERGVYAVEQRGMFIDIGTPDDYARAQTLCQALYQAAQSEPR